MLEHKNHTDIALKGVHSGDATHFVASKSIALEQSIILNLCIQILHKAASKYTGLYHITSIITSSSRTILSLAVKMILGCTLTYIYMSSTARYNYKYICDNKLDTKTKKKKKKEVENNTTVTSHHRFFIIIL